MTEIRRKDKEIPDVNEMKKILKAAKYVTVAMCIDNEPYLATLSHGYDEMRKLHILPLRPRRQKNRNSPS